MTNLLTLLGVTPFGAALDLAGNFYFTDSGRGTVSEWLAVSGALNTLIPLGSGLNRPTGLAVDAAGNVYIADAGNNAIEQWSPVSGNLTPLVASGLSGPGGVALDAAGNIYIADSGNGAIKEWLAASNSTITLASGLNNPTGIGVDASGNVYVDDTGNSAVREWLAASNTVVTLLSANLFHPYGLAVNVAGDVFVADSGEGVIRKLPHAWIDPTARAESAAAGGDVLSPVLPVNESLLPPFAPFSDQGWLAITSITNGSVNFSFPANAGLPRSAGVELLGVDIPVAQASPGNVSILGFTNRVEGPSAGADSVVLGIFPATNSWTAGTNSSWLHLGDGYQSGTGSTNVIFSFDANPGATRTGAITIANSILTVIQAGTNYVSAPASFTTLVGSGLNNPESMAIDAAGNLYFADSGNNAIKEWIATNNSVVTLASSGFNFPQGAAVDSAGNVYIADTFNNALKEWVAASDLVVTLSSSGLNQPYSVAVDRADNVYLADSGNRAIEEWDVGTLVSSGLKSPYGVAVDAAGNVYFSDNVNSFIGEWSPANNSVSTLPTSGLYYPYGPAVDGAGNIYFENSGINAFQEYSVVQNNVTTLAPSQTHVPRGMAVDAAGNLFVADSTASRIVELPRAFLDPTPRLVGPASGGGTLPTVLPATENLTGAFTPASDQSWLAVAGVSNGVVAFTVSANTGAVRVAHITLLGQSIAVTQESPTKLVNPILLGDGSFQFNFTNAPGGTFAVLSTSNLALPLSQWTPAGAPLEISPGQYLYTGTPATNSHRYYILRAP